MKFYKTLNQENAVIRLDKCDFNPADGTEITDEEYNSILNEIRAENEIFSGEAVNNPYGAEDGEL